MAASTSLSHHLSRLWANFQRSRPTLKHWPNQYLPICMTRSIQHPRQSRDYCGVGATRTKRHFTKNQTQAISLSVTCPTGHSWVKASRLNVTLKTRSSSIFSTSQQLLTRSPDRSSSSERQATGYQRF